MPFTYLIFKHKLSKISKKKISRQPTILSTKNYVTLIPHPWWRYVGARSNLVGLPKTKKKIFCLFYLNLFLRKINVLKNHIQITYLIKGTVLGRALWGVLTPFPHITNSRIQNPFSQTCLSCFWFSIVFPNKLWWRLHYFEKYLILFVVPVVAPVATGW